MIGGEREHFAVIEELFQRIASDQGYLYAGDAGSGHYLKMVHNGIEYGMMQAIGEGFELLQHSPYPYDNAQVAGIFLCLISVGADAPIPMIMHRSQDCGITALSFEAGSWSWLRRHSERMKSWMP